MPTLRARSPGFICEDDWGRQTAREDGLRNYLSQAGESLCCRSASTSLARAQGARSRFHLPHRRQPEAQPAGPLDSKHPNQEPASTRVFQTLSWFHMSPSTPFGSECTLFTARRAARRGAVLRVAFAGRSHRLDSRHLRLLSAGPLPLTSARSLPTHCQLWVPASSSRKWRWFYFPGLIERIAERVKRNHSGGSRLSGTVTQSTEGK